MPKIDGMNRLEFLRFLVLFGYKMGLFDRDLFGFLWESCTVD